MTEALPYSSGLHRGLSGQNDVVRDDILTMVYDIAKPSSSNAEEVPQFEIVVEETGNPTFERKVSTHDSNDTRVAGPHMLIGFAVGKGSGIGAGVYLYCKAGRGFPIAKSKHPEIWYNLKENHTVDPINLQVNIRESLEREHEPVYFGYNFRTGQSTYLLSKATPPDLSKVAGAGLRRLHPFTAHLVLLSAEITARMVPMAETLDMMLDVEKRLLESTLPTFLSAKMLKADLQNLHSISRLLVVGAHRTGRDLSNLERLLRDLERYKREIQQNPTYFPVDSYVHERLRDGFLALQDSCINIDRRLENRMKRVSNLIALLYNLMQNQDSTTMRRDSSAMKTIATLTMLFLPATFISSLFGTNFFALSSNGTGESTFIVSDHWWIFIACSIPLTLLVFSIWRSWQYFQRLQQHMLLQSQRLKKHILLQSRRLKSGKDEKVFV